MKESWENMFGENPASFDARIDAALASLEEPEKVVRMRFTRRAASMLAAAVLLMVLGGTALATDLFGLKSMRVADPCVTSAPIMVSATEEPDDRDVIALQGFPESREYKANAEWASFLASYDIDGSILRRLGNAPTGLDSRYDLYMVYTPDMAAKLDEITGKYALRLHESMTDAYTQEDLYSLAGVDPFLTNCDAVWGYVYEDGSFHIDGTSNYNGKCFEYQLGRYMKGSFSEVTLNVGNADQYKEWMYTTSSGVEAQLSMGPKRCVLMVDLPDAFVAINLLGGTEGDDIFMPFPVTETDLETFADLFIFSFLG